MLNEVYNRRIIELAGTIPRIGRLADPDATAKAVSRLCGSTVTVDLKMDGDTVTDFAHEVKACALGQASSSIMAHNVIGSKADELRELRETVRKMLKENGEPPARRQVGRYRRARAGARLQGAPRLDLAHLRRGGRRHRPDRGQAHAKDGRRGGITSRPRHCRTLRCERSSLKGDGRLRIRMRRAPQDDGSTSNGTCLLASPPRAAPRSAAAWSRPIATRSRRSSASIAGICRPAPIMPTRRSTVSACGRAHG